MAKQKRAFWEVLLTGEVNTERELKVLEYVCHRVGDGAHLRDVT